MASLMQELIATLQKEQAAYQELLPVVEKKTQAIIANDFGLVPNCGLIKNKPCIKYTETEFKASEGCEIAVELKDFTSEELAWWGKFGIGKTTLNKFFVFSCQKIYLNDHIFSWATPTTFNFGYFYPQSNKEKQYWRIYYPLNRKNRAYLLYSFYSKQAFLLQKLQCCLHNRIINRLRRILTERFGS